MQECECMKEHIFRTINTMLGEYLNISRQQMRTLYIYEVKMNPELLMCSVFLTLDDAIKRQSNEEFKEKMDDLEKMIHQIFLEKSDSQELEYVKGYFPSVEEVEISLLFIRCLWTCSNIESEDNGKILSFMMLKIPCFNQLNEDGKKNSIEEFNNMILPILSNPVEKLTEAGYPYEVAGKIEKELKEKVKTYLELYSQIFGYEDGRKLYYKRDLGTDSVDWYSQCFRDFFVNLRFFAS